MFKKIFAFALISQLWVISAFSSSQVFDPLQGDDRGYKVIKALSLTDVRTPLNDNDMLVFDIDGLLLSEGGPMQDAALCNNHVQRFMGQTRHLKNRIALTARDFNMKVWTYQNLSKFDINFDNHPIDFVHEHAFYYRGIFFSPNKREGGQKTSTKLQTLSDIIPLFQALGRKINRVLFFDNEAVHFLSHVRSSVCFPIPVNLYHYEEQYEPVYAPHNQEAPILSELVFERELKQNVYVFADNSGKQWVLKSWNDRDKGMQECLAALLIREMSATTPENFIYNDLPKHIKYQIGGNKNSGLYRLAEFIDGVHPSSEELKRHNNRMAIAYALISFWDVYEPNYIKDRAGNLHLIDTGGSLFSRAEATEKKNYQDNAWMKHQVSELSSFKTKSKYFRDFDVQSNAYEIQKIVGLRDVLLDRLDHFCQEMHYAHAKEIRHSLESRLNHLEFLSHLYDGKIKTLADPYAVATELDAAGTLVYCQINGRPHVLVGKRVGHNWWGNLGGMSEAGELLCETAARETCEESGNRILLRHMDLLRLPSHDLITVEPNHLLRKFRTYLVKQAYVDPRTLRDKEYTAYKWVPVEDLLAAAQGSFNVSAEGQGTYALPDGTILHPPFLHSLKQEQIRNWLSKLIKGQEVLAESTQSVLGLDLQHVHAPVKQSRSNQLQKIMDTVSMVRPVTQVMPAEQGDARTASYVMLDHLVGKNSGKSDREKLESVLSNNSLWLTAAPVIENIIQNERNHPHQHVLYHALNSRVWFMFRILSCWKHLLDSSPVQTDVVRSLDRNFEEYATPFDLLKAALAGCMDHEKMYQLAGFCSNPSLFSELDDEGECTLYMFLMNQSIAPPFHIWAVLEAFLQEMGLPSKSMVPSFEKIYDSVDELSDTGCLLQFFFNPEEANQICYPSVAFGRPLYDGQGKIYRDSLAVLTALKNGADFPCAVRKTKIQFRMHADLASKKSLRVYDHFADGSQYRLAKVDKKIMRVLSGYLYDGVRNLLFSDKIYGAKPPKLISALRDELNIASYERHDVPVVAAKAGVMHIYDYADADLPYTPSKKSHSYDSVKTGSLYKLAVKNHDYDSEIKPKEQWEKLIANDCLEMSKKLGCGQECVKALVSAGVVNSKTVAYEYNKIMAVIQILGDNAIPALELYVKHKIAAGDPSLHEIIKALEAINLLGDQADSVLQQARPVLDDETNYFVKSLKLVALSVLKEKGPDFIALLDSKNASPHNYSCLEQVVKALGDDCVPLMEIDAVRFKCCLHSTDSNLPGTHVERALAMRDELLPVLKKMGCCASSLKKSKTDEDSVETTSTEPESKKFKDGYY